MVKDIFIFILNHIRDFFSSKIGKGFLAVVASLGALFSGVGIKKGYKAKKQNKKAIAIKNEAIEKHDKSLNETEEVLQQLGKTKADAILTFKQFSNCIEKIQERPEFFESKKTKVDLNKINLEDLKTISNDLEMALKGAGGAVAGICMGLAIAINPLTIIASGFLFSGIVLCVDGTKLSKKAADNMKQAKEIEKRVEKIIKYYDKLSSESEKLEKAIFNLTEEFRTAIDRLELLVNEKSNWSTYTYREKKFVETVVLVCEALYKLCNVSLKENEEDSMSVNSDTIKDSIKESEKAIKTMQRKSLAS